MDTTDDEENPRRGRHCAEPARRVPTAVVPRWDDVRVDYASRPDDGGAAAVGHATSGQPGAQRHLRQGGQAKVRLVTLAAPGTREDSLAVERTPCEPVANEIPAAWDHPHLVKVLNAGDRRGDLLAYVPGGSVADLVAARGPLPVGEAVTILVPVAQALAHLHRNGAVHGDVSADNVLFDADGAPVLVDPGLARALGESGPVGGTEGFAAPEPVHGAAADVYGWAALAWFMLNGECPEAEAHRVPLPLLRTDVVSGASRLFEDCLKVDPRLRPSAADLAPTLLSFQSASPLDATAAAHGDGIALLKTRRPPEGRLSNIKRVFRGRKIRVGAGAGGVILALACLGMVWGAHRSGVEQRSQDRAVAVPSPVPGAEAALAALPELDRKRTDALQRLDAQALDAVYLSGPGLEADRSTIKRLLSTGQGFDGLSSRLEELRIVGGDEDGGVKVRATSVMTGPTAAAQRTGQPHQDSAAKRSDRAEHTRVVFTLKPHQGGYRIAAVETASATRSGKVKTSK